MHQIKHIQFGALTPDEWLKYSICEINVAENKGQALSGTVYDDRLGSLERGKPCATCGYDVHNCVGHFGYLRLDEPCYNLQMMEKLAKILQCVCIFCGKPRISRDLADVKGLLSLKPPTRVKIMSKLCKKIDSCLNCGKGLPVFEVGEYSLTHYYGKKPVKPPAFQAAKAFTACLLISDETMEYLGFNADLIKNPLYYVNEEGDDKHIHRLRPESLLYVVLPVPPTCIRPWVVKDGDNKDDDLTATFRQILKLQQKLRATPSKKGKKKTREEVSLNVTKHVFSLSADSSSTKILGNKVPKSFATRLKGKDGLVNANLNGKRVDFSARTVIAPGGEYIELGEVGVPPTIASKLTKPERVIPYNIEYLQRLVETGQAPVVKRGEATHRITNKFLQNSFKIQMGDIVERRLQNGDWGLFNRQPTLRIESMMGKKIRILPKGVHAFRLALSSTTPYNADFDGDEMNLHIPQSTRATVECMTIMNTASRIVTAQRNAPVMGVVQDGLNGSYMLTNTWKTGSRMTMVPFYKVCDCVCAMDTQTHEETDSISFEPENAPEGIFERWNSLLERAYPHYSEWIGLTKTKKGKTTTHFYYVKTKEIPGSLFLSILFPPKFFFTKKTETNKEFPVVKIENGIIARDSGPLCKKSIGAVANSVVHFLWKTVCPERSRRFLTEVKTLTDNWLYSHGLSVGISDLMVKNRTEIDETLASVTLEYQTIMQTMKTAARKEDEINVQLASIKISPVLEKDDRNGLSIMQMSGGKGSTFNTMQMTCFVGQQNVNGKRIPTTLCNESRALPHFLPGDNSPSARGFVKHNFLQGLDPQENYYHAISGRTGVIDTGIKTAAAGYIEKRLVQKLQDKKACIDGSIRDATGKIIQYVYGDDGMDSHKLIYTEGYDSPFFVNIPQLVSELNSGDASEKRKLRDVEIDLIVDKYIYVGSRGLQNVCSDLASKNLKRVMKRLLRSVEICVTQIPSFARRLLDMCETTKIQYGEMVGNIAALSLGEPTTQMTLNSVDWTENIFMIVNGKAFIGPVGKFIDDHIAKAKTVLVYTQSPEMKTEYVSLTTPVYVPSLNERGKMVWGKVIGLTRHDVGGDGKILKVKTSGGKEVMATKGKSFLVRENNKIVPIEGSKLEIGMRLPVTKKMPDVIVPLEYLDLEEYFPKTEYIYRDELEKMVSYHDKTMREMKENHKKIKVGWFESGNGKAFTVPFHRGDTAMVGVRKGRYQEGCVYPRKVCILKGHIKQHLKLDRLSGFFFGAYLAEGCVTDTYVAIANNAGVYRDKIREFADRYEIGTHEQFQFDKNFKGSTSIDIRLHSTMLAHLLEVTCGKGSENKSIPAWSMTANLDFVRGLLDGYFSGDGYVKKKEHSVGASSVSKNLIIGISSLCFRFGIYSRMKMSQAKKNNVGSPVILPVYTLRITNNNAKIFASEIKLILGYKQMALDEIANRNFMYENGRNDFIPGTFLEGWKKSRNLHRDELKRLEQTPEIKEALETEVIFEDIVEIVEIFPTAEKVYDLSVEDTLTFSTFCGCALMDTFHFCGSREKDVTVGIPRLEELISVSKDSATPYITVFFEDPVVKKNKDRIDKLSSDREKNKDKIQEIKQESLKMIHEKRRLFESANLDTFVDTYELRYVKSPDFDRKKSKSPVDFLHYSKYRKEWWVDAFPKPVRIPPNKWVVTLVLKIAKLYEFRITIDDIVRKIEESSGEAIQCIPSPLSVGKIDIYIDYEEITKVIKVKIDTEPVESPGRTLITDENSDFFYAREGLVNNFLKNILITGIRGVSGCFIKEDRLEVNSNFFLDVLTCKGVDAVRTTCNDLWSTYETLGIEAARKVFIREFTRVMSFGGTYVQPRFISLLADSMMRDGDITSASRMGIERGVGPMQKALFEQITPNFVESAVFTENDPVKSVAANIALGSYIKGGTGDVIVKKRDALM